MEEEIDPKKSLAPPYTGKKQTLTAQVKAGLKYIIDEPCNCFRLNTFTGATV